jgi:hypothetical protein
MTEHDTDIEFDFFEEPDTREAARPERTVTRGPRGPRRPARAPTGLTPLLRLVGLIAFAIVIVLVLVLAIHGCQSSSKHARYAHYMSKVRSIANRSAGIGQRLNVVLTTPGLRPATLQQQLAGLARQEEQDIEDARNIDPPGRLRTQHEAIIEALQFRYSGLTGLAAAFQQALKAKTATGAGSLLAVPAERLLTSDVIWDDRVQGSMKNVLHEQGVGDIRVPDSNFLRDPEFASSSSLAAILQRMRGAPTSVRTGGVHGTNLVSVKALPQGQQLTTGAQTTITATTALAFQVTVADSGGSAEVNIPVTLTISATPKPIVKRQVIQFINKGEERTITFANLGGIPIATPTQLRVAVQPVPGEHITTNNSATYSVIFSA